MKKASVSEIIHRPCETVFAVLHDYGLRLRWDTLLRKAILLHGAERAAVGVQSLCAGKWSAGGIPIISEYVTFQAPDHAAVKMVNRPPLFKNFAATIRHVPLGPDRSRITYTYRFEAKPSWLAWLLEPILNLQLKRETRKRLAALKGYVERESSPA